MSKLDNLAPTAHDGKYKVELNVEGEWIALASLSKEAVINLADYICSDELEEL